MKSKKIQAVEIVMRKSKLCYDKFRIYNFFEKLNELLNFLKDFVNQIKSIKVLKTKMY